MFPMIKFHEIWPCLGYPPFSNKPIFGNGSHWVTVKEFSGVWRPGRPEGHFGHCTTPLCFRGEKKWKNGPNHTMTSPRQNTENKSISQNNSVSLTINIQQYHFHHIHIMTHHENHLKSDWNNPVLVHRLGPQATFSRPLSILYGTHRQSHRQLLLARLGGLAPASLRSFTMAALSNSIATSMGRTGVIWMQQDSRRRGLKTSSKPWRSKKDITSCLSRYLMPGMPGDLGIGKMKKRNTAEKDKNGSHLKFLEPRRLRKKGDWAPNFGGHSANEHEDTINNDQHGLDPGELVEQCVFFHTKALAFASWRIWSNLHSLSKDGHEL